MFLLVLQWSRSHGRESVSCKDRQTPVRAVAVRAMIGKDMKFYNFRTHSGVRFFSPPTSLLSKKPLGDVVAHNITTHESRREVLDEHADGYYWHRRMSSAFQLRTSMVEVAKPGIKRKSMASDDRVILNGAAGIRARKAFERQAEDASKCAAFLQDYWSERQDPQAVELSNGFSGQCVIESKNFFNFFHFMTESLQKASFPESHDASIKSLRFVSRTNEIRPFVKSWLEDSGLTRRFKVRLGAYHEGEDFSGKSIVTPLSAQHLLYQFSGDHHAAIEAAQPAGGKWAGYDAHPHAVKILALNTFDDTLLAFRQQMIDLAGSLVERKWGSRIYVARSGDKARSRVMEGEDALIAKLQKNGFEVVCFENMSPLEQVRCVSGARCVVMQHGAGMSNMIFARENAHFFEIGTYQTAMVRWKEFIPLSHVAGCHYHHIFANMDFGDETHPVFDEDGLVAPRLDGDLVEKVVSIIKTSLKDRNPGGLSGMVRQCEYFAGREAYKHAYRLLDVNAEFYENTGEYWMMRALLNERTSHPNAAANNAYHAWTISGDERAWTEFVRLSRDDDPRRHRYAITT